ncbi:MAG: hypothetical protein K9K88_15005 [Desulfobacterales bacterium]|nr:hypothetical protein [Desulfobacterales bacterium]
MNWTRPSDLRDRVQKWWDEGVLLSCLAGVALFFPRRLPFKGPTSAQIGQHFDEVRDWIAKLAASAGKYRIVWRSVNHRILGQNDLPAEIWIDTLDDALAMIGRQKDAEQFSALVALTAERRPELIGWLGKRPLRALALADDWPRLLDIVDWVCRNPRPGIYLRQVDIAGVHSKFIESHRGTLAELLDLALRPEAVDVAFSGTAGFCRRYGFLDKPVRIRFRMLDPKMAPFGTGTDQDITVTAETFAKLDLPSKRVFITENEINFLAFPAASNAMAVFGAGYGFDMLSRARWLNDRRLYYWGDIDTHGFAILDQLRTHVPTVSSFLMDKETLMRHRPFWGIEPRPESRELPRLTPEESQLYDDLRFDRLGKRLRLEQERIGFKWVLERMKRETEQEMG